MHFDDNAASLTSTSPTTFTDSGYMDGFSVMDWVKTDSGCNYPPDDDYDIILTSTGTGPLQNTF